MSMTAPERPHLAIAVAAWLLAACLDPSEKGSTADVAHEVEVMTDTAVDPTSEVPDAVSDVATDSGPDIASDSATDAAPEIASDAAPDIASDAAPDIASDSTTDTAPDIASDSTPDTVPDAAPDASTPPDVLDLGCEPCTPDCSGTACGSDGCGGLCGSPCDPGFTCYMGGCVVVDPPNCMGWMCGDDLLGGLCGVCPQGWTCEQHTCVPDNGDCSDLPPGGTCVGGAVLKCVNGAVEAEFCPFYACLQTSGGAQCEPVECLPDCFGKQCGPDGCGGTCGTCEAGESCMDQHGICTPGTPCEDWLGAGSSTCRGHHQVSCLPGAPLDVQNCLAEGMVCGTSCGGPPGCHPPPDGLSCMDVPDHKHCAGDRAFSCSAAGTLEVEQCPSLCTQTSPTTMGCGWLEWSTP